jgi:hypothetical protein
MFHQEEIKKMEETKKYLDKLRAEMVMKGYNDGWYNQWVSDKIKELEEFLNKYKHDI